MGLSAHDNIKLLGSRNWQKCICDPTQQKVQICTKINVRFIAVWRRLSSILFHTICENNNFGLLASVLEGWKWGKNHNVPQNNIKNPIFFLWLIWPQMSTWPKFQVVYSILMEWEEWEEGITSPAVNFWSSFGVKRPHTLISSSRSYFSSSIQKKVFICTLSNQFRFCWGHLK